MNNLENVNVGDKLFVSNGWIGYLETVERLTNTLVITKVHSRCIGAHLRQRLFQGGRMIWQ